MLYNNINYKSDISYLSNTLIREYDMSKANINILFSKGIIDRDTYEYLYNSERMVRQIYVGKLLQNNSHNVKELQSGIIEAKKQLFIANNIQNHEVLSIKNDAVFIINRQLKYTKLSDLIEFKEKSIYSSFYNICGLEIYYYYNSMSKEENIDIKGIGDDTLIFHKDFMIQFLKDVFYTVQVANEEVALRMLKDFYNDYINYNLAVGYYREFNVGSKFLYNVNTTYAGTSFSSDAVSENDKRYLNITYNLKILLELQKILMSMYFSKHK